MNKAQKEVQKSLLNSEQKALKDIQSSYEKALKDVKDKIKALQADELTQSKIYQIEYQKALKSQVETILDSMNSKHYDTIQGYLKDSYYDSFIGTMYDLQKQGIPLIMPIDQNQVVKAVQIDSKLSESMYKKMGKYVGSLKKAVTQEISRGLASNLSYADIARNLDKRSSIGIGKTLRIARTEGHRVQQRSTLDAQLAAKDAGADVVKQWDSTMDKRTRPLHAQLDGQIREVDEPFEVAGREAMYPGDFGVASQDIHCRCVLLQRAKWALDEDELNTLKERAKYFGLDKTDSFEDFKGKYLDASKQIESMPEVSKGFKEAKTIEEAHKMLVDDIGFDEVEASFKQIDERLAIDATNQLGKLESKFGAIHKSTGTIFSKDYRDALAYVSNSLMEPLRQGLSLCPRTFRSRERLIENELRSRKSKWSMPFSDDEVTIYTVTHEYGHVLQNKMKQDAYVEAGWSANDKYAFVDFSKKSSNAMNKWYLKISDEVEKTCVDEILDIAKKNNSAFSLDENISSYGKTQRAEFFAEVFANSQLSKPNELGKAMNIWLKQKGY